MSRRRADNGTAAAKAIPPLQNGQTNAERAIWSNPTEAGTNFKNKEVVTRWGWGRPTPPLLSSEFFAYANYPWWITYVVNLVLTFGTLYAILGCSCSIYWWIAGVPVGVLFYAFPSLAFVIVPYTWVCSPGGKGNPEQFFTFKDKAFERKYRGQKIPIETLYEAYFDGKLDLVNPDLLATLYERESYSRFVLGWNHIKFFLLQFIPELLTHSRSQDVEQVRGHYDRGDDFYAGFLGPTMIYTGGIFHSFEETLEEAQANKMNLIANKIHLKPGDQHLDIGCGWGTFISHCAKHYGTDSTGVTLGINQTKWANDVAAAAGVSERARALCMDYRDIPERTNNKKYDKITCLEMSEHVGVKYYSNFCQQVKSMLKDDGVFYLQIAGLRRAWQFEDFNWGLFMGKYIFPGADASCPLGWVINQLESNGFEIRSEETMGIHYSATIKRWYDNWVEPDNQKYIEAKYGQRWFRLWQWFLAWSVISPEQGSASCYQIVAHKNTRSFDRKQWVAERSRFHI